MGLRKVPQLLHCNLHPALANPLAEEDDRTSHAKLGPCQPPSENQQAQELDKCLCQMALNYEVASHAARVNWYSNDNYRSIEIKFRGLVDSGSYDYIIQSLLLIWKNKWDSIEQIMGLPGGSRICLKCRRPRFELCVRKIPWRRGWQPPPVFLHGKFHRQRSLVCYSSWGHRVGHDWVINTSTFHFHSRLYYWFLVVSVLLYERVILLQPIDNRLGQMTCFGQCKVSQNEVAEILKTIE